MSIFDEYYSELQTNKLNDGGIINGFEIAPVLTSQTQMGQLADMITGTGFINRHVMEYTMIPRAFTIGNDSLPEDSLNSKVIDRFNNELAPKRLRGLEWKRDPSGIGVLERLKKGEKIEKGYLRLMNWHTYEPGLIYIEDPELYRGAYLSREFAVHGSKQIKREIIERGLNVKNDPETLFRLIAHDPVFENVGKMHFIVIGSGIGFGITDAITRIGGKHISLFELPGEKVEVHNAQRIPGLTIKDIGQPKWELFAERVIANNPFADFQFYGAFNTESPQFKMLIDQITSNPERIYIPIIALDDMKGRFAAYEAFKDITHVRIAPTDIGNGSLLQLYSRGQSVPIPNLRNRPDKIIIDLLGGPAFATNFFDAETLESFIAMFASNAYGYFPQTAAATFNLQSMISSLIMRIAKGQQFPSIVMGDPENLLETSSEERRQRVSSTAEVLRAIEA